MIGRLEQAKQAWFDAHQELMAWLGPFVYEELARAAASAACASWLRDAMDGTEPANGPYEHLFRCAFARVEGRSGSADLPPWETMAAAIPEDGKLLPYQLCKQYSDAWRASQLLDWDKPTRNRVSRLASLVYPVSQWGYLALQVDIEAPAAVALARCAFEVLSTHECLDCDTCTQHAARWENADATTERWFTGRRLARTE